MEATGKIWILYNSKNRKQTKPLATIDMQRLLLSLKLKDLDNYFIWTPGWSEWKSLPDLIKSKQKYFVINVVPKPSRQVKEKIDPTQPQEETFTKTREVSGTEIFEAPKDFSENTSDDFTKVDMAKKKKPAADYGYYFDDFKAEDIDIDAEAGSFENTKKTGVERRINPRHDYKLEIILISRGGRTFRSHSRNISLAGTMLEDPVPKEFLNTEFELIIINKFEADRHKGRLYFQGKIIGDIRNAKRLTFKEAHPHMTNKLEMLLNNYLELQKRIIAKKIAG